MTDGKVVGSIEHGDGRKYTFAPAAAASPADTYDKVWTVNRPDPFMLETMVKQ